MVKTFVPDIQDIVWLDFTPQAGHEQAGHRPALVLTPREYNEATGLMICCPITTTIRGMELEVKIPKGILKEPSVALVHQVKTVDYNARKAQPLSSVPLSVVNEVKAKLAGILEID